MRMSRHFVLAVVPVLMLASCDPFDLVEPRQPRPIQRQPGFQQLPRDQGQFDNNRQHQSPDHGQDQRPDNRPVPERYPMAERTANPNQVLSPFPPYNVIDVTGFNPGQLARDPSNNEIFRIP